MHALEDTPPTLNRAWHSSKLTRPRDTSLAIQRASRSQRAGHTCPGRGDYLHIVNTPSVLNWTHRNTSSLLANTMHLPNACNMLGEHQAVGSTNSWIDPNSKHRQTYIWKWTYMRRAIETPPTQYFPVPANAPRTEVSPHESFSAPPRRRGSHNRRKCPLQLPVSG